MLTIKIQTGNAAFHDGCEPATECARILRDIADRLERGDRDSTAFDINGNNVATFRLTNR